MSKTTGLVFIALTSMPIWAWACSQAQPTAAFILRNDNDSDQKLNLTEWLNAKTGHNLIASFKVGDPQEFARFDANKDGYIETRELGFDAVRYREEPCSRVQARMFQNNRMGNAFAE